MVQAEEILNNRSYEYTTESIGFLRGAINRVKEYKENLKIKPGIEEPAGEPIAIINKKAVETSLGNFIADESVAGADKIKITFDCAPDVSFNPYASIEIKATIAGTESYMKFTGTDANGTSGA